MILPPRYELLAAQAFDRDLLTEGELARMLGTDRVTARARVQALMQQAERAENGEWRQVTLELNAALVGADD